MDRTRSNCLFAKKVSRDAGYSVSMSESRERKKLDEGTRVATEFWRSKTDTHLAPTEYYLKAEDVLRRSILPLLPPDPRILDIGCGNGEYTLVLARQAAHVDGFDLSPHLVAQARRSASVANVQNIKFAVGDLAQAWPSEGLYDSAFCMGVLSTIIDPHIVENILMNLLRCTRDSGLLVLRESFSLSGSSQLILDNVYPSHYHSEEWVKKILGDEGVGLIHKFHLGDFVARDGTCSNNYYVFSRIGNN
jgi:SAM-dependent methyltransferase